MKIECNKKELQELVSNVTPITKAKSNFSILSNVLIEATENELMIKATSMEREYTSRLEAKIAESGAVTIPQAKLLKVLKKLPDGDIILESDEKNIFKINYSSSKGKKKAGRITMIGTGIADYPDINKYPDSETALSIEKSCFQRMIKKTIFAVSNDSTQYTLNGLLFELKNETFKMVGIDGRRMALCNSNIINFKELSIIVPTDTIKLIHKLLKNMDGIDIAFSGDRVYFKLFSKDRILSNSGDIIISSFTLQGKFPNYNMFISEKYESEFIVNKKELVDSLSIVSEFAGAGNRVIFEMKKDKMILSAYDSDLGESKDEIKILYSGEDRKIGFNPCLLKEILDEIESYEIKFNFNPGCTPIKMHDISVADYFYILMPLKLDN
jgi:DNA polymerase-3 subunit beta